MDSFNLLEKPWILVIIDQNGTTALVSLKELFLNANKYIGLGGETEFQNFAILRLLLAILYTVFSRLDDKGISYPYLKLDEKYLPENEIDEEDASDYNYLLNLTWQKLWHLKEFPAIIIEYLEVWKDNFDFYDEDKPFYQVSNNQLQKFNIGKNDTGYLNPKFLNRLLSESNNKKELFTLKSDSDKHILSDAELVRWLITYQGYTGTSEKKKFPQMEGSASKGWLLGLGGIYISGDNLKETLLLNLILSIKSGIKQTPVWEKTYEKIIEDIFQNEPNNLADLYTYWSRLLLIDLELKKSNSLDYIRSVQLPGIDSKDYFLEPQTLFKYIKKNSHYAPAQHDIQRSFWQSFGQASINNPDTKSRAVGVIDWIKDLIENEILDERKIRINAVGVGFNQDASNIINSEIYDSLNINDYILSDILGLKWLVSIEDEITLIKTVIEISFKRLVQDVQQIRNLNNPKYVESVLSEAYSQIDEPFRNWLEQIVPDSEKSLKIEEWRKKLFEIVRGQGDKIVANTSNRDLTGINVNGKAKNIVTVFNDFIFRLNKMVREGVR